MTGYDWRPINELSRCNYTVELYSGGLSRQIGGRKMCQNVPTKD